MNLKRVLVNLAGIAAAAYGTAATSGSTPKTSGLVAVGAILANLVGLFQPQPHK